MSTDVTTHHRPTAMAPTLDFTAPHLLRSGEEYDAAHGRLLALLDQAPAPGTPAHDELEFLTVLVAAYDDAHSTIGRDPISPQDAVRFALDQRGWGRAELAPLLGGKARVSEFFAGKRALSVGQVRTLRAALGLPADLLIAPAAPRTVRRRPS